MDKRQMKCAAAEIHHEDQPVLLEAQAVAQGGRHRLIHESDPPYSQGTGEGEKLGPVDFIGLHRHRKHGFAKALPGPPANRYQEFAQESPRHPAGGIGPVSQSDKRF
jgi:hypothetical protein